MAVVDTMMLLSCKTLIRDGRAAALAIRGPLATKPADFLLRMAQETGTRGLSNKLVHSSQESKLAKYHPTCQG